MRPSGRPSPIRLRLIDIPVGKEILHQRGLLREDRQKDLRRPGRFTAALFPIKQSAFGHPNALRELELGQSCFRAESRDVNRRDFNARLSAGAVARADIGHRYLQPIEGAFSLCHGVG